MASFQKRNKTWQYTVSNVVDGKSKPIRKGGFKTKKEAQVAAAEVEANLAGRSIKEHKNILLSSYFEDWYKLYKGHLSNNTIRNYKYTLKIINEYFPYILIQSITKPKYQEFLNEISVTKAQETIDKIHGHIRACVHEAIEEGIIEKDFTNNTVAVSRIIERENSEKHLNYNESLALLNKVCKKLNDGQSYYAILLLMTSGLRFAELVGLTYEDFNFTNNTININKTWGYTKDMHKGFGPTKNKSSNRVIKMDSHTMTIFKKLIMNTPTNKNNLVFYSARSKYKVISNSNTNNRLKKLLKQLNIDPITCHGLRHTHASILIYKRDVTINYISARLGHKDTITTLNKYSHLLKELKEEDEITTNKIFKNMLTTLNV